ncbi:hypothetical protein [Halomicrococcus sp. SG-WS-1]|uniref:hypothetical protein n=1 Tax=Halomicrococcus sp. SG-WS-1 TaxID=3439057 RepID=UPI003F7AB8A4
MTTGVPKPLALRDPSALVDALSPGDRVRITTTKRPPTILTVADTTHPPSEGLIFSGPPLTTTARETTERAHYHCTPTAPDSLTSTMTVIEIPASDTPTQSIGILTTIAHLPRLSSPPTEDTPTPAEVDANE